MKILQGFKKDTKKRHTESTIAVTLAEHLLSILAPNQSYSVDKKSERCECGFKTCEPIHSPPNFGNTSIGMSFLINILN